MTYDRACGACVIAITLAMGGCAGQTQSEPRFMVDRTQQAELRKLFNEVQHAALRKPRSEITHAEVARMLAERDADVAKILEPAQFASYQAEHRERLAGLVYLNVRKVRRSGPPGRVLGAGSPAGFTGEGSGGSPGVVLSAP